MDEKHVYVKRFRPKYVEDLIKGRDTVMDEIVKGIGVSSYGEVRCDSLNKRGVTKEKVCEWLEKVSCILNSYSIPLLENAVPFYEECEDLKNEKIEDQRTIIALQEEIICKKDEEMTTVKESLHCTVQKEMKSYASAVTKTCTAVLAPKNIRAAIKTVADKEDRRKNVIIYGVKETEEEDLTTRVEEVLLELNEKPVVRDCCRIGTKKEDSIRPIKFILNSADLVTQILAKSKMLKLKENYRSIYICPDRTVDERLAFKKIREERRVKKEEQAKS